MNKNQEKVLDHEYDGIQEFDNPLPSWWLTTFYGTILFAFLYVGYYHFGPGTAPIEQLAQDLEEMRAVEKAAEKQDPGPDENALLAIFADPTRQKSGQHVFAEKCATCHGAEGGGLIGPNLTDNYWLHGKGNLTDLAHIVSDGVPEKGMPPWKTMLKKDEIYSVIAYVKNLKGTRPANAKAPQGTEIRED